MKRAKRSGCKRGWRLDFICLLGFSVASQLMYLRILNISYEGDASGYFLEALYFAGDPHGAFLYYRPPGYPLFMVLTGLTWLHSFDLAIAVQACMGVAGPLLVFGTLCAVNRPLAMASAGLYALSGLPYTYAQLFTTEQV